ncbi:NEP1-interacting protein 1 [Raphanus sativus]|nr:NEP1-interacting protein 1 [Raphanus sativus]
MASYYRFQSGFCPLSPCPSLIDNFVERIKDACHFLVSAVLGTIVSDLELRKVFPFLSCSVGTLLGALTGALIGQETESGFIRGAAIGAISGAVFSIEVFESSLDLWKSDESCFGCLLYLIDVIVSLLSGRLVRERIGPAMLSAVQSQMGALDASYDDLSSLFETGGPKGLTGDLVEKIPKLTITGNNNTDASESRDSCSVCLQDFQLGETVRSLPHCHHMFHLPCIDKWLLRHGSCPMCRRDL